MATDVTMKVAPSRLPAAEREQRMTSPGFGKVFSEHMVRAEYRDGAWQRPVLTAYEKLSLDPASSVLHYGQAIFEGFKAYRRADGGISTFRPDANAARFNRSAIRLAMPEISPETFVDSADALIRTDHEWVSNRRGESLYLRPVMMGNDEFLGVRPATNYLFYVIASPVGEYFPNGVKPVTVWLSEDFVRAAPGGTGFAKFAGNYAASLLAQKEALTKGCDQVVWLDAVERRYIEEMGGMNMFFVMKDGSKITLVTPKLTGTLLPGITRDSLLKLAPGHGFAVEERLFSKEEWAESIKSGRLVEAFACGTAAVITPIGQVKSLAGEWTIGDGGTGPVATALRQQLLDIQYGVAEDKYGWVHRVT
jgi:branched-chain amino acid aminotransferase